MVLIKEINSKDLSEVNDTNVEENSFGGSNSVCGESCRRITDIEEIADGGNPTSTCEG